MKKSVLFVCSIVGVCLPVAISSAQWDPSVPDPNTPSTVVAEQPPPAPPDHVIREPAPVHVPKKSKDFAPEQQWGLSIGVPIFLDIDHDVVRPGALLHGFFGLDIGYFVFSLGLGFQWTPIEADKSGIPELRNVGRSPVNRFYFSPEVRVQLPERGRFLPYLSAAFDMNWWNYRETDIICSYWYCSDVSVYRFTPGFTGKVGAGIKVREGTYLDLGVSFSLSGEGDFFERKRYWVGPYIGVLMGR